MRTKGEKPATMSDVARRAGVSLKTVSRVFNKERYVAEDKRDAVLKVAAELDYQPAIAARGLAGNRSFMIGLFVDDASGDYVLKVIRGLLKACHDTGNHLVVEVLQSHEDLDKVRSAVSSVRFDGVVLPPPLCDSVPILELLAKRGIPAVRVGPGFPYDDFMSVAIDERSAARDMTLHLLGAGHRRIGFIKGDPEHACSKEREAGFRDAMKSKGADVDESLVVPGLFHFESGRLATIDLMANADRPSAIFASNDEMAAGAYEAIRELNLSVPNDVSVVGFDDDVLASVLAPALTTVRQPVEDMATAAVKMLTKDVDVADSSSLFPFNILSRASVRSL